MKIKHWQGYGSVNAKKISREESNDIIKLHIKVSGNHEYGVERDDLYDIIRWIGTRFDKQLTDHRQVIDFKTNAGYDLNNHEETCDYYIMYRKSV